MVKQLNEFLISNIIKKQEKQINLSFCYYTIEIDFENIHPKENISIIY